MEKEKRVFKYPGNPFFMGNGTAFFVPLTIILLWFIGQNLQALKILATKTEPAIIGFPPSLFYTLFSSVLATASVYYLSVKWGKGFAARAEKYLGRDG